MDGLWGPVHMGTGGFFRRRAFFGGPFSFVAPENPELSPDHVPNKPIRSKEVLSLAYQVAGCNFDAQTKWGSNMGYRYGSLVEDFYTSYRLHCEGWRSIFCHPKRAAFLGDVPVTLNDVLYQIMRWSMGLLEVGFSKNSPLTLALLNSFSIFPKVSDPWFFMYAFLFLGAYAQDFMDFMLAGGTIQRWWNSQRMWILRGVSSFSFGLVEYLFKSLGLTKFGFNVTSKVVDNEQGKRYEQGIFEFGVESKMFLPITMAAIINLVSFVSGIIQVLSNGLRFEDVFTQLFIAGFGVLNSWPVYEAMVLRSDKGKLPTKITLTSVVLSWLLYLVSSWAF
ncbi:unnamed protein product [Camellia sinensis]